MKRKETTRIVFRRFPDGEIIALFPDESWNKFDYTTASYMHVGQHGGADYRHVVTHTRPAAEPQYRDLLAELQRIGYHPRVIQRARLRFN